MGKRRHPERYTRRVEKMTQASHAAKARHRRPLQPQHPANWRVQTDPDGTAVATEPGRECRRVFQFGADPFWTAVQFAAAALREESAPAR